METQDSPNSRPRSARRMRDEDDATTRHPQQHAEGPSAQPPGASTAQAAHAQAPPPPQGAAPQQQVPPVYQQPVSAETMLTQMMHFMMQIQQQQQQQQYVQQQQLMAQQAQFQQEVLSAQTRVRLPHKKKGDPPMFLGKASEDLELWIFSTEQYYAEFQDDMKSNSSGFVTTIIGNLGPAVQTWYREFLTALGAETPATWELIKQKIRERFRDSDFEQKVLSKMFELRVQGAQQDYTNRFLNLLSLLEVEVPEFIKRWFYQQNLQSDTSSFISQQAPETLAEVIDLAQRFEDSRPSQSSRKQEHQSKSNKSTTPGEKRADGSPKDPPTKLWCSFCKVETHSTDVCRRRKAAEAVAAGKRDPPKNGEAR